MFISVLKQIGNHSPDANVKSAEIFWTMFSGVSPVTDVFLGLSCVIAMIILFYGRVYNEREETYAGCGMMDPTSGGRYVEKGAAAETQITENPAGVRISTSRPNGLENIQSRFSFERII
jgi:hypothetical protein